MIYKWPTLVTIHRTNPLVTIPDLYIALAPHLVSTTYKNKVTADVL